MPISPEQLPKLLTVYYPEFEEFWNEESLFWPEPGEPPAPCGVMAEFSHLIVERLRYRDLEGLPEVFGFIDMLLLEGEDEVRDAVEVCFLETLENRVPEIIQPRDLAPLLGPEASRRCRLPVG